MGAPSCMVRELHNRSHMRLLPFLCFCFWLLLADYILYYDMLLLFVLLPRRPSAFSSSKMLDVVALTSRSIWECFIFFSLLLPLLWSLPPAAIQLLWYPAVCRVRLASRAIAVPRAVESDPHISAHVGHHCGLVHVWLRHVHADDQWTGSTWRKSTRRRYLM